MSVKTRIPTMSKARQALFAAAPWINADMAQLLHAQLITDYDKLISLYDGTSEVAKLTGETPLPFTDDKEHNGNLILEKYLANTSPYKQAEYSCKLAERALARSRQVNPFRIMFHVQLCGYWQGNILGFDITKFDKEIVKPAENESTREAILRQWGEAGLAIITDLMR